MHNHSDDTIISIGLVQWQVERLQHWSTFEQRTHAQVKILSKADFLIFPEYFTLPLLQLAPAGDERAQLEWLGRRAEEIRDHFSELARLYGVNIIAGSTPELTPEGLYNTSWFCHRDGRTDRYRKLHLTPYERDVWDMLPGDQPGLVKTDRGYAGICICYDVEFPELCRAYAEAGANLIFVPYCTSTEYGHHRVHNCARARAVENECYVATAGNVGNLPEVPHLGFQSAQSGLFTPCDFGFPLRGIAAEAPLNAPAAFRINVDMKALRRQEKHGTVLPLQDRRTDLYHLKWPQGEVQASGTR